MNNLNPIEPNVNNSFEPKDIFLDIRILIAEKIIKILLPIFIIIALSTTIFFFAVSSNQWMWAIPGIISFFLLSVVWWLVKKKKVLAAANSFFLIVFIGVLSGMLLNGGAFAPVCIGFIPLVFLVPWFYSRRITVFIGATVIIISALFVWLAYRGLLREIPPITPFALWFLLASYLLLSLITAIIPNQMLRRALAESESRRLEAEIAIRREAEISHELGERDEALRESEQILSKLTGNLPDAMLYQLEITSDRGRRFTYVSDNIIKLNEVSIESALADANAIYNLIHPDDRAMLAELEQKAIKKMSTFRCETRFILPSGTIRWFQFASSPRKLTNGKLIFDGLQLDITDKKLDEALLRLFKQSFDSLTDEMAVIDNNYRYIIGNYQYLKNHRVNHEELQGKALEEWIGEVAFSRAKPRLDMCLEGKELTFIFSNDDPIRSHGYIEVKYYPIMGDKQEILGIGILQRDITDQKQNEAMLQFFKQSLDSSTDAMAAVDKDYKYIIANDRYIKEHSFTQEDFRGRHVKEGMGEKAFLHAKSYLDRALQGETVTFEFPAVNIERGPGIYESSYYPLINDNNEIKGVVLVAKEITERKNSETMLRMFKQAFDSSRDSMAAVDKEYKYIIANSVYIRGHKYVNPNVLTEGIQGHYIKEEVGEAAFMRLKPYLDRCFNGEEVDFEYTYDDPGKGLRYFESSYYPLRDDLGEIQGAVFFNRDITDRKTAEDEKKHLEEMLRQSQKIEAIGQLAGGIAHDLNNMLTPVIGFSELIMLNLDTESKSADHAKNIVKSALKARDLVQQLLAFSRKQTLEFTYIDLNLLIEDFKNLLRSTIREDITISIKTPPSLPVIQADKGQIEQVLMNLVVNAQDAMPEGGLLSIETGKVFFDETVSIKDRDVKPGKYIMMSVSDTGIGMDEYVKTRIFEPFFSTKGAKGTGLGLAMVYGIVKQHNGTIFLYSESGKGTTVKVYLPVATDEESEPDQEAVLLEEAVVLKGSETILLAEDDESVCDMAALMLEEAGYTVFTARTAMEALDLFDQNKDAVKIILTDVIMPELNGKELYNRIIKDNPDVKVIFMSGYTDNVIAHHGVLDKGTNFIQKPFSRTGLLAKVRDVLNK